MAFQGRLPLSALWLRHSAEVADWLTDILAAKGVEIRSVDTGGITGAGLERSLVRPNQFWNEYCLLHRMGKTFEEGENVDWMAPMVEYAMECGAVYHYNTTAEQLVRDGDGRVTGVIARDGSGELPQVRREEGRRPGRRRLHQR